MSARVDLINKEFGDLVVISFDSIRGTHAYWRVKCKVCDLEKISSGSNLIFGMTSQCNSCYQESRSILPLDKRFEMRADVEDKKLSTTQISSKFGVKRSYVHGVSRTLSADLTRLARLTNKKESK